MSAAHLSRYKPKIRKILCASTQKSARLNKELDNLRKAIDEQVAAGGRNVQLQIDGGVKAHNIAMLRSWGVTNCVVGSGLFNDRASVKTNLEAIHDALA